MSSLGIVSDFISSFISEPIWERSVLLDFFTKDLFYFQLTLITIIDMGSIKSLKIKKDPW